MLNFAIYTSVFGSVGLSCFLAIPVIADRIHKIQNRKVDEAVKKLDDMFVVVERKRLFFIHMLAPVAAAAAGFVFFHSLIAILAGAVLGAVLPAIIIKSLGKRHLRKFNSQLVDGLMVLSSSLKAGLAPLQAVTVLTEEMPPPLSQEFALVVRENKMGVTFDQSLERLGKRMKSEDLDLIVTAMRVARETGGNLIHTFDRLMATMREKNKLQQKVTTLTTQGRLQGIIMSVMPIFFAFITYRLRPDTLQMMLQNQTGRALLAAAVILEIAGIILIRIFSRVEV
ncbi:unnamed protein product [marine sediment metagenome]|uniref:Type II secretion system protein GspF domain-containing protein n=1 Tax=marine sediment metagenome TaxID=412755 RepID=X0YEB7_9ZZZZ